MIKKLGEAGVADWGPRQGKSQAGLVAQDHAGATVPDGGGGGFAA